MIRHAKIMKAHMLGRKASRVKRYHTMPLICENTVGQHTFNLIGILLTCIPPTEVRTQLLAAAYQHDLAEAETGDVPSHSKRAMGGMDALERLVLEENGHHDMSGYLFAHEVHWLKMADILEGWSFAMEELQMGNRPMFLPCERYAEYYVDERARLKEVMKTEGHEEVLRRMNLIFRNLEAQIITAKEK